MKDHKTGNIFFNVFHANKGKTVFLFIIHNIEKFYETAPFVQRMVFQKMQINDILKIGKKNQKASKRHITCTNMLESILHSLISK
jgi:hypothetical protein